MRPLETDQDGKRKTPRTPRFGYEPKANIRASYRLGITLIDQLESLTQLLSQWHKKGSTYWPRFHYRITTSDIARNLIKMGLEKLHEDADTTATSHLELLLDAILEESPDYQEADRHLAYTDTKKYGAAGSKRPPNP